MSGAVPGDAVGGDPPQRFVDVHGYERGRPGLAGQIPQPLPLNLLCSVILITSDSCATPYEQAKRP